MKSSTSRSAPTSSSPAPAPGSAPGLVRARVPAEAAGRRLDLFLLDIAGPGLSRARIQDWLRAGRVRVDGRVADKPSLKLAGGEDVEMAPQQPKAALVPERGALTVLHEDPDFLVLDKPPGLTVHPAPGEHQGTLLARALAAYPELGDLEGERPGVVHRIDKDTSGLLLLARNEGARLELSAAFARREVYKEYLALCHGVPPHAKGLVDAPMGRDPDHRTKMAVLPKGGREARSAWRVLWADPAGRAALLAVRIFTGRTHQIRVHMAHVGLPLLGDRVYASLACANFRRSSGLPAALGRRQMLHAWRLGLEHPRSGEYVRFTSPPARDFTALLSTLSRVPQRVAVTGLPGSGKSALLSVFARAGVPVFSADAAVAALYAPGAPGWELLRRRFGEGLAPDRQPVDKAALFARMRDSDGLRREVEHLLHPLVRGELEAFWARHARARLAAAEVPLLLEAGWSRGRDADLLVGVSSPQKARWARLAARGLDPAAAAALDSWQWPQDKKLAACDLAADNAGSLKQLEREAGRILGDLRARRRAAARESLRHFRDLFAAPWSPEGP